MNFAMISLTIGDREIPFHFRKDSVGDNGVITQIFKQNDYGIEQWQQGRCLIAHYQHIVRSGGRPLIVDAGANIGASALWFSIAYPEAFIFAIEPEENNFQLLELNTANVPHKSNFRGGIASEDGLAVVSDPGFSDWAFRTTRIQPDAANGAVAINTISPQSILSRAVKENLTPLILKVDIEGAESDLFAAPTDWLSEFPLVVIELHDWMFPFSGSSKTFLTAVAAADFDVVHRGENTFCFNRRVLQRYTQTGR